MKIVKAYRRNGNEPDCLLDDDIAELLKNTHIVLSSHGYARVQSVDGKQEYLHRLVTAAKPGEQVDHINGNKLDNRRENLRKCTSSVNILNRHKKTPGCTSEYVGVSWDRRAKRWRSYITLYDKQMHIGAFRDKEIAREAREVVKKALIKFVQKKERQLLAQYKKDRQS